MSGETGRKKTWKTRRAGSPDEIKPDHESICTSQPVRLFASPRDYITREAEREAPARETPSAGFSVVSLMFQKGCTA
ncbi:hypothetical protein [Dialister sp.]|uniref:hypothetical protein n=1 Tax=Dialister sp. TaxID=1955814 RepID=UPI003EFC5F64